MVHHQPAGLDAVFRALADPTRRAVVERLQAGEHTVGDLAEPFGMSLPGFMKHLGVLEGAGVIERRKSGRVVSCRLKDGALRDATGWLERHEAFWNTQLDRLDAWLERKETVQWTSRPPPPPASKSGAASAPRPRTSTRRGRSRTR